MTQRRYRRARRGGRRSRARVGTHLGGALGALVTVIVVAGGALAQDAQPAGPRAARLSPAPSCRYSDPTGATGWIPSVIVGVRVDIYFDAAGTPLPALSLESGPQGMTFSPTEISGHYRASWTPLEGQETTPYPLEAPTQKVTVRATSSQGSASCGLKLPVWPLGTDVTPPRPVPGVRASGIWAHGAHLEWEAARDDSGVRGYRIYEEKWCLRGKPPPCGVSRIASTPPDVLQLDVADLLSSSGYTFYVTAFDAFGNEMSYWPLMGQASIGTPAESGAAL